MRSEVSRVAACLAVAVVAAVGGCGLVSQNKPVGPSDVLREPPSAAEFIARHNDRVAKLNRLWMRTELWLRGTSPEGEKLDEVTEGHLMVELPRNLSLTVKKLGETYFVLGSNAERYWWLDLSREERPGLWGEHARATRERVERFGLPVLPSDLIELLAITPIDPEVAAGAKTRWVSENEGEIVFAVPGGARAVRFSAKTLEPTAVELRDETGFAVVASAMSEFEPAPVRGEAGIAPRFQRKTDIMLNELEGVGKTGTRVRVTITAYDAENRPLNPALFDLPELVKRHRVGALRSVDEMERRP